MSDTTYPDALKACAAALKHLDPKDDNHWTASGEPKVAVLQAITQNQNITRKIVDECHPNFTRAQALAAAEASPKPQPTTTAPESPGPHPPSGSAAESAPSPAPTQSGPPPEPVPAHLYVPPGDEEILGMDPTVVFASFDLLERAVAEFTRQCTILQGYRNDLTKKYDDIARRGMWVSERLEKMKSRLPRDGQNIRDYIDKQNEIRSGQAKAAQRFYNEGTTPQDVAKSLDPRTPIDRAMASRKPGLGDARPQFVPK